MMLLSGSLCVSTDVPTGWFLFAKACAQSQKRIRNKNRQNLMMGEVKGFGCLCSHACTGCSCICVFTYNLLWLL